MTETKSRAAVLTEISLIFAAVFWGLNFAATKYAAESIPPLVIVAFRFTGGGLLLLLILRLLEPESRPGRKDLILMAALGCFGVAIAQSGFTFGVSLTSAASTGLIFATAPVWGLLLGAVLVHIQNRCRVRRYSGNHETSDLRPFTFGHRKRAVGTRP